MRCTPFAHPVQQGKAGEKSPLPQYISEPKTLSPALPHGGRGPETGALRRRLRQNKALMNLGAALEVFGNRRARDVFDLKSF